MSDADIVRRKLKGTLYCETCKEEVLDPMPVNLVFKKQLDCSKGFVVRDDRILICPHCYNTVTQ